MKTLQHSAISVTASCALLFAVGCTKKEKKTDDNDAEYLQEEGTVFRDGFMEQTIPGMTRGVTKASHIHADCVGYLPEEPTLEVTFTDDVPMRIHVTADDDLVLAVRRDDEVHCNDDFDGHQPSIARTWEKGRYTIYVGTKSKEDGELLYELNFDHYDPSTPLHPTPAVTEEPKGPFDAPFELPHLENPTPQTRLTRGTLPVHVEGAAKFDVAPYVPNGIARHEFELDKQELKSRTHAVSKDDCNVLLDASTPDYIIDLWADGDMNLALQSVVPMGLVVAQSSDRVYCAVGGSDDPAALRFENLSAGKYAVYMTLLPSDESSAAQDASASEEDRPTDDDAESAARIEGAARADDVAARATTGAAQKITHVRGRLHIY